MAAHHITGADCFIIKVFARSTRHLERITGRLATPVESPRASCTPVPPHNPRLTTYRCDSQMMCSTFSRS